MKRALPIVIIALLAGCGGRSAAPQPTTTIRAQPVVHRVAVRPVVLTERLVGSLPAASADPSPAVVGATLVLNGGLTSADTSSDGVVDVSGSSARTVGRLPTPRHDTAAAGLGRYVYVFGGGNGVAQLGDVVRVDPRTGASSVVAKLPAPSSDSTGTALGGTAYVVGGFTGTAWLDTIVAYRPGGTPRVVGHLPVAVRYAAVTAAAGRVVVAGGSLPDGTASSAIYGFDPATRRVSRIGSLPAPTTHAAAASLGGIAYVIGGRSATLGDVTGRIVAIDVAHKGVRAAGSLATPRSDLAAADVGGRIVVAGGKTATAVVSTIARLVVGHAAKAAHHTIDLQNVYKYDTADRFAASARSAKSLVYVPNSRSDTVDVIDPATYKVVEHFAVGALPQHIVPAYDLKTLYVTNDLGNSLTTIDPRTGKPGRTIPVDDPYNMYFTPDGRYAIVVAERLGRLDFRDAHTFALHHSTPMPCLGVDHMDFSADERYLIASCEFSGELVKVDVRTERVLGVLHLPDRGGMPQDVKLSPDGKVFYVADTTANGVWKIDGARFRVIGFVHTGAGAHGLYPSRDAKSLYVTNRGEGSVSVLSFRTRKVVATWHIPGGGSPDMGGVSPNGKVLWLSGRYNGVVYALSTSDGRLLAKIPVGSGPHGLCVWPQPGRYSLGHTGIMR